MADGAKKTPIQDDYVQRFTDDLANTRKEQEEVTAQISGLRERLEQLRTDEAWLTQVLQGMPAAGGSTKVPAPAQPASGETTAAAVPDQVEPARETPTPAKSGATPGQSKKSTGKSPVKKTATAKTATKPIPAPTGAAKKTTAKAKPALHELVLKILLAAPGEPHVTSEVHKKVTKEHPERNASGQMVRNSLDTLVKRKLVEKTKQKSSAMYTAHPGASPAKS
ncbi:hypothetical protein [Streptomyces sp. NBC_00470]|uniref:hypothetical protein n=1 Tax=Streptomyces sp. NBC_00470 TaxID=2975753 RepID=UPI002F910CC3